MNNRLFRLINVFVTLVLVLGLFWGSAPATAQDTTPPNSPLQLLAEARGVKSEDLVLQNEATFTLLDGRQVTRVKAMDMVTGEPVVADFSDGKEVDYAEMQAEAGKTWRAAHGALPPDTVSRLAEYAPEDKVNIAIWLASSDLQEVVEADYSPMLEEASSTSANADDLAGQSGEDYSPPTVEIDGELYVLPLNEDEIPEEIKNANVEILPSQLPVERSEEEQAAGLLAVEEAIPMADAEGQIEATKQANLSQMDAQVASLQGGFAGRLAEIGLQADYASPIMPSVYLSQVPVSLVEQMAMWPEIDAIYLVPDQAGDTLEDARPAQNADLANWAGYTGSGVKVAVLEGERAFFANPKLDLAGCYPCGGDYANHPTAVAGFIKSKDSGHYGLAYNASVYSAHGTYSDWSKMTEAMDWASTNTTVINNSWYWDWENSPTFWEADRRLDYIVRYRRDFVAVAAGNFGSTTACVPANPGFCSDYITSPAKGYNVMTVGNNDDVDNTNWADDFMRASSSWGDPGSDAASPKHSKPEVSAIGTTLTSTIPTTASPYVGEVGSGTSYSSPMVAALAADLIQADPNLATKPEALRAIIMVSALQNIEGSTRYSDKDGAGAVDFTAALSTVEQGAAYNTYGSTYVNSSTTFPLTYSHKAYKGERVRFVITWLSNPNSGYTTDVLPADLDLYAYRADGTTVVASSASSVNNFEIVEFTAPESETYQFKIHKWSFTGNGTYLGRAVWRGEFRISPNTLYSDPPATPIGTPLSIHPADWSPASDWHVMGIRSNTSDHDLYLYSASYFDNPSLRSTQKYSITTQPLDLIVVDNNHRSTSTIEHYRVVKWSGTGGYSPSWSNNAGTISTAGTYGPYTKSSALPARMHQIYLTTGTWKISIIPVIDNASNLSLYLFDSSPGSSSTWLQSATQAISFSNTSDNVLVGEAVYLTVTTADYHGLVVGAITSGKSNYYIKLESVVLSYKSYLPSIRN